MLRLFLLFTALFCCVSSDDEVKATYSCDFETDTCGFVNLPAFRARWERKEAELGGRKSYVMILNPRVDGKQVGRMQTPFFEINKTLKGCLSFDLYLNGEGADSFRTTLQDAEGFEVIQKAFTKSERWQRQHVAVTVHDYAKAVFEGVTTFTGQVAVDNFVFKIGNC